MSVGDFAADLHRAGVRRQGIHDGARAILRADGALRGASVGARAASRSRSRHCGGRGIAARAGRRAFAAGFRAGADGSCSARRRRPRARHFTHRNETESARGFFEVFDVQVLAGRAFGADDFESGRNPVLINRTFAERFASGQGGPLGRRIRDRFTQGPEPEAWHEIVGVVADFPANDETPRLYLPMTPGQTHPLMLTFRINPGTEGVAGRLREIAASLDARFVVDEVYPLDALYLRHADRTHIWRIWAGDRDVERAAAFGGRNVRADVVHRESTSPRNRDSLGARRPAGASARGHLQTTARSDLRGCGCRPSRGVFGRRPHTDRRAGRATKYPACCWSPRCSCSLSARWQSPDPRGARCDWRRRRRCARAGEREPRPALPWRSWVPPMIEPK